MKGPGSAEEERLKQLMLTDLAFVHQDDLDPSDPDRRRKITMQLLLDQFEYMYAYEWSQNPLAMGT